MALIVPFMRIGFTMTLIMSPLSGYRQTVVSATLVHRNHGGTNERNAMQFPRPRSDYRLIQNHDKPLRLQGFNNTNSNPSLLYQSSNTLLH
jgi:hypothetical protein